MSYAKCRNILRKYFSEVVYIDDRFDTSLVDRHTFLKTLANDDGVPLPQQITGEIAEKLEPKMLASLSSDDYGQVKLAELLIRLNSSPYENIRLSPVLFHSTDSIDVAVNKMLTAPLSIIDWDLRSGKTAYDVINVLFDKTNQLKVIAVYTQGFDAALKDLDTKLGGDLSLKKLNKPTDGMAFALARNKSLVVIADKQKVNLDDMLEAITDRFLETYGTMPVALLDVGTQIAEKSGTLFSSFAAPLDGMYFLQNYFSGADIYEFQNGLTSFLLNKIKADAAVDMDVIKEIYDYMRDRLNHVVGMDDDKLSGLIQRTVPLLGGEIPEKYRKVLSEIPVEDYKAGAKHINDMPIYDWKIFLTEFRKSIPRVQTNENKEFVGQIWPLFIQLLISGEDLLNAGVELITNLKYYRYDKPHLMDCLGDGSEINGGEREAFLFNKLHFGDILVSEDRSRFLLCITPPCDVLRPEKINLNISFVVGNQIKKMPENLKDGRHVSLYPDLDVKTGQNGLKYISWNLYEGVRFDLRDNDRYRELCSYFREYRLDEQYARQIANKYIAYYSRAGVNELFMKENRLFRDIWK